MKNLLTRWLPAEVVEAVSGARGVQAAIVAAHLPARAGQRDEPDEGYRIGSVDPD